MLALFLLPVVAGQLTNDVCLGATPVGDGNLQSGNNFLASPFPQSTGGCVQSYDVFYVYTPTCNGTVSISVFNASAYIRIGAFVGRSCSGLGECTASYAGLSESLSVKVYGATDKLYFAVGSDDGEPQTAFLFNISCAAAAVAPGDICTTALPILTNVTLNVSTANAASDSQDGSGCTSPDVFFVYNATCNGDATATAITSGGSYPYIGSFFPGTCDQIVSGNWRRSCTYPSTTWPVWTGQLYYLAVGYYSNADYSITIQCDPAPRPANDECSAALPISSTSIVFDTTNATASVPYQICSSFADQDVWFSYNATCTGDLKVQFNDSYTYATAFRNCWNTPAATCVRDNTFVFPVTMNEVYKLVFGSYGSSAVEANFTCEPVTRPSTDKCVNGLNVTAPTSQTVDLANATTDSYTVCAARLHKELYFRYTTCAGDNSITVESLNGSALEVAAYGNCAIDPLACVYIGYSDGHVEFTTPIPVPVYIGVGYYSGDETSGWARVNFSCTPSPTGEPTTGAPTTQAPSRAPTGPTTGTPTTVAPSQAPSTPTTAPTLGNNTNTTSNTTAAPTLSGAGAVQISLGVLFLGLATQM